MDGILPSCTFPNVYWFSAFLNSDDVVIDIGEHFVKQSFRNRMDVMGHLGRLNLSFPVNRVSGDKTPMKNILLFEEMQWKRQHWRSILSAYNSSPYFDYYRDSLEEIFKTEHFHLAKLNDASAEWLMNQLKITKAYATSEEFIENVGNTIDYRSNFKGQSWIEVPFPEYFQVFDEKISKLSNLSLLDVLCNLGPESKSYLIKAANSTWPSK